MTSTASSFEKFCNQEKNNNKIEDMFQKFPPWVLELNSSILIAIDGSKGEEGVSLAALNVTYNRTLTLKLHPKNSVFTAERCAILIAIERFIQEEDKTYILCSDSLSVLKSLESLHRKSPAISLQIGSAIIRAIPRSKAIKLVWVPAHVSITINDQEDAAAKAARTSDVNIFPCVSTEDLRKVIFRVQADQGHIQWESTKYFRSFMHLPKTTKTQPQRKEILLSRLRTRSLQSWSGIISLLLPVRHSRFERPPLY
ncbi:hypothetical protein AVEN_5628-1 [Araneus ventricosus]|uniref:RNase H type-1 domain-containing protein n=1 Tax=Araneus ventricosus TaxID=182803 RepID=A0A4Y2Q722_ARAVE|nr:hypothetical protein AVEN_5628-1 [Araneus ventricosus]